MIGSGEAESRAVAGAVNSATGQARLDTGVNITGLLVESTAQTAWTIASTSCVGSSPGCFGLR
jgi:hypothetical protein